MDRIVIVCFVLQTMSWMLYPLALGTAVPLMKSHAEHWSRNHLTSEPLYCEMLSTALCAVLGTILVVQLGWGGHGKVPRGLPWNIFHVPPAMVEQQIYTHEGTLMFWHTWCSTKIFFFAIACDISQNLSGWGLSFATATKKKFWVLWKIQPFFYFVKLTEITDLLSQEFFLS